MEPGGSLLSFDAQRILDLLPDAVVAANASGEIVYANAAVTKLLGWSAAELVEKPITTIVPARLHEAHTTGFRRYLATDVPRLLGRSTRVTALRRDGTELDVELTLSALREVTGRIFVASLRATAGRLWLAEVRDSVEEALSGAFRGVRDGQRWAVFVPVAVTLVVSAISVFEVRSFVASLEWVDHTDRVIAKANEVRRRVIDLETAKRGFVITGDRAFLEPYEQGVAALATLYDELRALVSDNPAQVRRVGEIEAREKTWRFYAQEMIDLREHGGDYPSLARTRRGKEQMDELRALFAEFLSVEQSLRDERSRSAQRDATGTIVVVGCLLLLGTSLLIVFHRRQLKSIAATYERAFEDRAALVLREKAAREQAEAAVRARDVFLAIASHELRTPLTPLTLHLHSIERMIAKEDRGVDPAKITEKVRKAAKQVTQLERLVSELLDVSRLTEDRLRLDRQTTDLASVVSEAVERKRPEIEEARCALSLKLEPGVVGEWDRLRLDQVVTNLLDNAVKYGSGKPIEVEVRSAASEAVLVVRDQGIGIGEADQERIFGRFERAVSDNNYGGFGLGLWISRHVVEAMGGRIGVSSKPNEGATFTVILPAKAAAPRS